MPAPLLLKRDWQRDHVYLVQFPDQDVFQLNGRQIPDSNHCIEHLTRVFKIDLDERLNAMEKAQSRAFTYLLEESIRWHTANEVESIAKKDLTALSIFLGDKRYFLLDAIAFGNLTQVFYTPMNTDILRKYMEENTPNLVSFIQQMREMYWKDWDEACQTLSLDTENDAIICSDNDWPDSHDLSINVSVGNSWNNGSGYFITKGGYYPPNHIYMNI
ncbi:hypothetical protein DINM_004170 [Dirofilaria immitis]|nr:hypothetical protein [Dirofilaria immitis]